MKECVKIILITFIILYEFNLTICLLIIDPALNYMMVLQYANQSNLREFLKNDFDSLHWKDKFQMALDITLGLKFLHSKNIIHGNLVCNLNHFIYSINLI
jgi:serine/threonine protein kinase